MRCISCFFSSNKMAPYSEQQNWKLLIAYLQFVIIAVSAVLHLHFMLMFQLLIQHQQLKQQLSQAIEEKHHALTRYRQLRNGFIRRRKRHWKNPGRTDKWWRNFLHDAMLLEAFCAPNRQFRNAVQRIRFAPK